MVFAPSFEGEGFSRCRLTGSCIATASGLSAIAAVLSAHAARETYPGVRWHIWPDPQSLRERTHCAWNQINFFSADEDIAGLIQPETSLVFIEVPPSDDADAGRRGYLRGCTPARYSCRLRFELGHILFNAHALGIDISIHSATKFINGHSDLMLGLITGSYGQLQAVRNWCDRYGSTSWGGFESLVLPAIPYHLRSIRIQPDEGRLVRLHIGMENVGSLSRPDASAGADRADGNVTCRLGKSSTSEQVWFARRLAPTPGAQKDEQIHIRYAICRAFGERAEQRRAQAFGRVASDVSARSSKSS